MMKSVTDPTSGSRLSRVHVHVIFGDNLDRTRQSSQKLCSGLRIFFRLERLLLPSFWEVGVASHRHFGCYCLEMRCSLPPLPTSWWIMIKERGAPLLFWVVLCFRSPCEQHLCVADVTSWAVLSQPPVGRCPASLAASLPPLPSSNSI